MPVAGVGHDGPDNIYFTFQFYRFPPVTSQQLKLLTSDKVHHKTSDPPPCILASINNDGTVNSGKDPLLQKNNTVHFLRDIESQAVRWALGLTSLLLLKGLAFGSRSTLHMLKLLFVPEFSLVVQWTSGAFVFLLDSGKSTRPHLFVSHCCC